MTNVQETADTTLRKEVRLALVLNGGVSLAVWMGGVVHELDLLRRASKGESEDTVSRDDIPAFRLWKRIAESQNKRILVDVIAGTSAGGLNGTLLATAVARGVPLPDLRGIWEKTAALDELLSDDVTGSLMQGAVIEDELAAVFQEMGEDKQKADPVTLFLTGTALDGGAQKCVDGYLGEFDVADHRRIYRFMNDQEHLLYELGDEDRWQVVLRPRVDFSGNIAKAGSPLIRASRATAGFPVAFSPVDEQPLRPYWPQRSKLASSCVMDGGVLNNEPFKPVLEAISERRVDGDLERVLVYVVPSEGRVAKEKIGGLPCDEISWADVAMQALSYPRESNFRAGIEDLSHQLQASVSYKQESLFKQMRQSDTKATALRAVASLPELVREYRLRRAVDVVGDARKHITSAQPVRTLTSSPDVDGDRIVEHERSWLPPVGPEETACDAVLKPTLDRWRWGIYTAERVMRLLMVDLQDRLRDHEDDRGQIVDTAVACALADAAHKVSTQLRGALAVMGAVWDKLREDQAGTASEVWVADRIDAVFSELGLQEQLAELVRTSAETYLNTVRPLAVPGERSWGHTDEVVSDCLTVEVLTNAFAPATTSSEPMAPKFSFLRLGSGDLGPLFHKDQYAGLGARKLYGVRFGHFGAFFKVDWRKSDYAWGRLDAAHHLLRLFYPNAEDGEEMEKLLHEAILEAEVGRSAMEANLAELKTKDKELWKRFIGDNAGRKSLTKAVDALCQMLDSPSSPDNESTTQKALSRVLPYVSATIDTKWPRSWNPIVHVLHFFSGNVRRDLRRDPGKLGRAVRRDVRWFGATVLAITVGVGVLIGFFVWS